MRMTQSGSISTVVYPRISIIGAGIAGLSLACRLQELKIPFNIYESRTLDTIGHNYGITLHRRAWRPLVNFLRLPPSTSPFRQATAVDRVIEGKGKVSESSPLRSATFQAVDKDVRRWLVQHLSYCGVQVNWDHKLTAISKAAGGPGADLSFENKPTSSTDIIVDAGGLRSPAFDNDLQASPKPKLLQYATYYGTRKIPATEFSGKLSKHFRTGNTIELIPEADDRPYISLQKVHLPNKSSKSDDDSERTVELRWVFSRPPRSASDPLYRPNRTPAEAKDIPIEFYQELMDCIKTDFVGNTRFMLTQFFNLESLHDDRILNWHLRLRLPEQDYLCSNSDRDSYKVIAIGDAAHGLPIVKSNGANIAMYDANHLSRWLSSLGSPATNVDSWLERNFYRDLNIYPAWLTEAQKAIQVLRKAHGQKEMTQPELTDIIGFALDNDQDAASSDDDEVSSTEGESYPKSGRL